MSKHLRITLLVVFVAVIGAVYVLISTPDYGDTNADGLTLGKTAYQQGDFDTAAKWFQLAARKGDKQAQYRFAMLYRDGKGVDHDDIQAVRWLKLAAAQHHIQAQYQLGTMLEHGRGVDAVNATAAFKWFKQAALAGHAGAQLHLAIMYETGHGTTESDEYALNWAVKAASSGNSDAVSYLQQLLNRINAKASDGDPTAQFVLARSYEQGHGLLHADKNKAGQWLRQSAARGNPDARFHLAELLRHRQNPQAMHQAAALYLKAANQGQMQAAANIGVLYASGQGVVKNPAAAMRWLEKAATANQNQAQSNLGILLASMHQDKKAIHWLTLAANSGEADARNNLAVMLALGRGVKQDLHSALQWMEKAATADPLAQYNLGLMYLRGVGMVQNEEIAADWLNKAQASGNVQSRLILGLLYDLGRGVISSSETAEQWYSQAAEAGNTDAVYNLAVLYYGKSKFNKSFSLFKRTADAGDLEAQNIVASMFQQGQGAAFDMQHALQWYKKAAGNGYAPAQFNLGNLYRKGDGMEQRDDIAVNWYRKAAVQGYAPAQNALAYMYTQGRGVVPDRQQAVQWLQKAADQGLSIAKHNLSLFRQKQSGFTLASLSVDFQIRTGILTEKPLDLARRLQWYRIPRLH